MLTVQAFEPPGDCLGGKAAENHLRHLSYSALCLVCNENRLFLKGRMTLEFGARKQLECLR